MTRSTYFPRLGALAVGLVTGINFHCQELRQGITANLVSVVGTRGSHSVDPYRRSFLADKYKITLPHLPTPFLLQPLKKPPGEFSKPPELKATTSQYGTILVLSGPLWSCYCSMSLYGRGD